MRTGSEPNGGCAAYGSASTGSRYNPRKTLLASANSIYVIGKNMSSFAVYSEPAVFLSWIWHKVLFFVRKEWENYI